MLCAHQHYTVVSLQLHITLNACLFVVVLWEDFVTNLIGRKCYLILIFWIFFMYQGVTSHITFSDVALLPCAAMWIWSLESHCQLLTQQFFCLRLNLFDISSGPACHFSWTQTNLWEEELLLFYVNFQKVNPPQKFCILNLSNVICNLVSQHGNNLL